MVQWTTCEFYSMTCRAYLRGLAEWKVYVLLRVKTLFSLVSICSSVKWGCKSRIVRRVKHHSQDVLLQIKCALCFFQQGWRQHPSASLEEEAKAQKSGHGVLWGRAVYLRWWCGLLYRSQCSLHGGSGPMRHHLRTDNSTRQTKKEGLIFNS